MSLIPSTFSTVSTGKWDLLHLRRFLNWSKTGIPEVEVFIDTCEKVVPFFLNLVVMLQIILK